MSGGLYLSSTLVIGFKKSLKSKEKYKFTNIEEDLEFEFLNREDKKTIVCSPLEWIEKSKNNGIKEVYLYMMKCDDYSISGYANTSSLGIITIDDKNEYYFWSPNWTFNNETKAWLVTYKEHRLINFSKDKIIVKNNISKFKDALKNILEHAKKIGLKWYINQFNYALCILEGKDIDIQSNNFRKPLKIDLDGESKSIMEAVNQAWVFGGMGSWNDSPFAIALELGIEDEYKKVSSELWNQLYNAVFYAINNL